MELSSAVNRMGAYKMTGDFCGGVYENTGSFKIY